MRCRSNGGKRAHAPGNQSAHGGRPRGLARTPGWGCWSGVWTALRRYGRRYGDGKFTFRRLECFYGNNFPIETKVYFINTYAPVSDIWMIEYCTVDRFKDIQQMQKSNWWYFLSTNTSTWAKQILLENPDKIDWYVLSSNGSMWAIELLQKNPDKINWRMLSQNPCIIEKTMNRPLIEKKMNLIKEDLIMSAMHPKRLKRWIDLGGDIDDF